MYKDDLIDKFVEQKECDYKGEHYSVRDNGAIYRHAITSGKPRKLDETWTFGKKDSKSGYMLYGGHRVHIIVARAFLGERDSKEYVVDHIDTNRCNNRVENLRWFTKLENALYNPVTFNKILFLCDGNIQKFLDNPSCLKELGGEYQNVMWMRTVSSEEARNTFERVMKWAKERPYTPPSGKGIGEWIYKPFHSNRKSESPESLHGELIDNLENWENEPEQDFIEDKQEAPLTDSLIPNAKQRNWRTPTCFPLCPDKANEDGLKEYYDNLEIEEEFCYNNFWSSNVFDFAKSDDNEKIWVICDNGETSMKRWALVKITFENGFYVHTTLGTYFQQDGAIKYFTLAQGKEWTGGEVFDDCC